MYLKKSIAASQFIFLLHFFVVASHISTLKNFPIKVGPGKLSFLFIS